MDEPAPSDTAGPRGSSVRRRRPLSILAGVLVWAAVALPATGYLFVHSSRTVALAGHEAEVSPTLNGWVTIDLGPFLPGFRYPTDGRVGADVELGRTSLDSYEKLFDRYAFIASQPAGQIRKVRDIVSEMALDSALTGALLGLSGPAVWVLLGPRRRRELVHDRRTAATTAGVAVLSLSLVATATLSPWDRTEDVFGATRWQALIEAVPDVTIPAEAAPLEVDTGLLTNGTRRLVESALNSYRTSNAFYQRAADEAATLADQLHQPAENETVAVQVSDRHDNIGMDPVARAIADAGGATFLIDSGDDTSTGSSWEAFSLESLDDAFHDFPDRYTVAGNHDHGGFITKQAAELGFTPLQGEVVDGPDGIRLLGVDDPRSSGLGNWRDETGLSFDEVTQRVADAACAADAAGERVSTIVVHDRNNGREALERGCVDLVLSGHLHVIVGPETVIGPEGQVGHTYTTASTGGAAYAIAIGTKPRRDAVVSLITYRQGRPIGIQWVRLSPLGDFTVGPYTLLAASPPSVRPGEGSEAGSGAGDGAGSGAGDGSGREQGPDAAVAPTAAPERRP